MGKVAKRLGEAVLVLLFIVTLFAAVAVLTPAQADKQASNWERIESLGKTAPGNIRIEVLRDRRTGCEYLVAQTLVGNGKGVAIEFVRGSCDE